MAETQTEREDVELGRFEAGREQIVIRLREFKGKQSLDVRRFYETDAGEWAPSKKGCSIPAEHADDVVEALKEGAAAIAAEAVT